MGLKAIPALNKNISYGRHRADGLETCLATPRQTTSHSSCMLTCRLPLHSRSTRYPRLKWAEQSKARHITEAQQLLGGLGLAAGIAATDRRARSGSVVPQQAGAHRR